MHPFLADHERVDPTIEGEGIVFASCFFLGIQKLQPYDYENSRTRIRIFNIRRPTRTPILPCDPLRARGDGGASVDFGLTGAAVSTTGTL